MGREPMVARRVPPASAAKQRPTEARPAGKADEEIGNSGQGQGVHC